MNEENSNKTVENQEVNKESQAPVNQVKEVVPADNVVQPQVVEVKVDNVNPDLLKEEVVEPVQTTDNSASSTPTTEASTADAPKQKMPVFMILVMFIIAGVVVFFPEINELIGQSNLLNKKEASPAPSTEKEANPSPVVPEPEETTITLQDATNDNVHPTLQQIATELKNSALFTNVSENTTRDVTVDDNVMTIIESSIEGTKFSSISIDFTLEKGILSNEVENDDKQASLAEDTFNQLLLINASLHNADVDSMAELLVNPEVKKQYKIVNGFEIVEDNNSITYKIDINKKPFIYESIKYLKLSDLKKRDELLRTVYEYTDDNMAIYVKTTDTPVTIVVAESPATSTATYKSITNALTLLYGSETANSFKSSFPQLLNGEKDIFKVTTDVVFTGGTASNYEGKKAVVVEINKTLG